MMDICDAKVGDSIFLSWKPERSRKNFGNIRNKIAKELNLIDNDKFAFCWIVDYPMYEKDEKTGKIIFSHNPFSMPQGI